MSALASIEWTSCGDVAEAARQRQQVLALFVEHVFLLVIGALDRKAIDRQLGVLAASRPARCASGMRSSSGVNHERGFRGLREENLHLLPAGVRARCRAGPGRSSARRNTRSCRRAARGRRRDERPSTGDRVPPRACRAARHIPGASARTRRARLPFGPAGIDVGKIPGICFRYLVTRALARLDGSSGGHLSILVDLRGTSRRIPTRTAPPTSSRPVFGVFRTARDWRGPQSPARADRAPRECCARCRYRDGARWSRRSDRPRRREGSTRVDESESTSTQFCGVSSMR